ncbi:baculoviral IAP repeat-containing protein 7-A-like [Gigantopelta aegis]|uniref:baculoviral IAP repeat-containing protein 7-A-like n=1 Tax=Gigantopelta aegis TaxID=1735272 RepID=UPI001B88AEC9|nr:baculoviral IAP repeat-containing protein 7-A-like [Gigantopelta aegis]
MDSADAQAHSTIHTTNGGQLITEADRIKHRVDSFQGWRGNKTPTQLAIAGFRYTGLSDKVICDTCALKLYNWLEKDNPVQTHKLHSPDCSFIKKWFSSQETSTGNPNTQASLPPPRYPNYSTYEDRVDSFYGWPCKHEHQSPSCMAQQGFFYIGSADRVSCFQCGLRLRDWDECDYPSDCHREWSPDCPFINKRKPCELGATVKDTVDTVPETSEDSRIVQTTTAAANNLTLCDNNTASCTSSDSGEGSEKSSCITDARCASDVRQGQVDWSSPKIQAVLEMGCSKEIIEQVTTERLRNAGKDFLNAASLYEAILKVEHNTA